MMNRTIDPLEPRAAAEAGRPFGLQFKLSALNNYHVWQSVFTEGSI